MSPVNNAFQTTETAAHYLDGLCGVLDHGAGIRLVNLTPDTVRFGSNRMITVPPSGTVTMLGETFAEEGYQGITCSAIEVQDLPSRRHDGTFYIVSREVARYLAAHEDYSDEPMFVYPAEHSVDGSFRTLVSPRY